MESSGAASKESAGDASMESAIISSEASGCGADGNREEPRAIAATFQAVLHKDVFNANHRRG